MSVLTKETGVLPGMIQDHSSKMYNLQVSGEDANLHLNNKVFFEIYITVSSKPLQYKSIYEEIDLEEWKKSLRYDSTHVDNMLKEILIDFDLEINSENMDWLKKDVGDLISLYEKKYNIQLQDYMRSALERLAIRMAYDKICLKGTNPRDCRIQG